LRSQTHCVLCLDRRKSDFTPVRPAESSRQTFLHAVLRLKIVTPVNYYSHDSLA